MRNKKIVMVTISIVILLLALSIGTLKTSDVSNFPVPITATVEKVYSEKSKAYSFIGINRLYLKHVRLYGWKQIEQMGSLRVFENNGEKVEVITNKNGFSITSRSER